MNNNIPTFIIDKINRLPFIRYGNKKIIVDTGSPESYGRISEIQTCNQKLHLESPFPSFLNKYMPEQIIALIGMDILGQYNYTIERASREVILSDKPIPLLKNKLKLEYISTLPVIEVNVNDTPIMCIFDTGAEPSYIASMYVSKLNPIRKERDFSPMFGIFTTDIYEIDISFMDITKPLKTGELPKNLETKLSSLNIMGIMGMSLFSDYKVVVSSEKNILSFE